MAETEFVDYYEFLMVSPQADRAMIEWAVRHMLARYGPKSPETADEVKYETTKAAYRALVDAAKREEYDQLWNEQQEPAEDEAPKKRGHGERRKGAPASNLDIDSIQVELDATADDVRLQVRIRQAILSAIYDVMIKTPRSPEMGRSQIAKSILCRIDDLEFPIWYLRECGLIKTSNAGDYSITAAGIQWVEEGGVPHLMPKSAPQVVEAMPKERRAG